MYASLTSLSADRQDNFFSFQKKRIGEEDMATNPKGWLADAAGQQLLGAIVQASTHYLDTIDYGRRYGSASIPFVNGTRTPELSGDNFHVWASVHAHCSSHPTHVHPGASLSGVIYLSAPPDTGSLGALPTRSSSHPTSHLSPSTLTPFTHTPQAVFSDPRGHLPPFERRVAYHPLAGEWIIFPPWLPLLASAQTLALLAFHTPSAPCARRSLRSLLPTLAAPAPCACCSTRSPL